MHALLILSRNLFRSIIFVFGYIASNIHTDITLPSLLVSILYLHNFSSLISFCFQLSKYY